MKKQIGTLEDMHHGYFKDFYVDFADIYEVTAVTVLKKMLSVHLT